MIDKISQFALLAVKEKMKYPSDSVTFLIDCDAQSKVNIIWNCIYFLKGQQLFKQKIAPI